MQGVPVPDHLRDLEGEEIFLVGPPRVGDAQMSEEDCASIEARVGRVSGGAFDGARFIKVYWKPDEEEVLKIVEGKPIELELLMEQLVPHSMAVVL